MTWIVAVAAGAFASATTLTAKSAAPAARVTGSALSPAGRPLTLTVTGSLNAPLRRTLPLNSAVVPAFTSRAVAARATSAGRTTLTVTAGIAIVCSPPVNFPLACRPIVIVPRGASTAVLTATAADAALSATVAAGTARPGGRG